MAVMAKMDTLVEAVLVVIVPLGIMNLLAVEALQNLQFKQIRGMYIQLLLVPEERAQEVMEQQVVEQIALLQEAA